MSGLKYLVVIGLIFAAAGFASEPLGEYFGPLEYQGYLGFGYPEGENPINNIVFTVDSTIADNLIILDVPSPWSSSYSGGILTLSGGSLSPGGEVLVKVSLNKYFDDGEYTVNSVGTTTSSETSQSSGLLLVGELTLLNIIGLASENKYLSTGVVVSLGLIEIFLMGRNKKEIIDDKTKTVEEKDTKTVSDDSAIHIDDRVLRRDVHNVKIDNLDPELLKKITEDDNSSEIDSVVPELTPDVDEDYLKKKEEEERKKKIEEERLKSLRLGHFYIPEEDVDRILKTLSKKDEKVAETPDEIAKKIGDSFLDGAKSSDGDKTEVKPPEIDDSEYDDSDLPGLDDPEVTGEPEPPTIEYDDSDLPGLKHDDKVPVTNVYGVLGAGLTYFPFILKSNIDKNDPQISEKSEELGLLESDLEKLGELKLDFGNDPKESVLDNMRITPRLSGQYTWGIGERPIIDAKINFKSSSEIHIPLLFNGEPVKPLLGQIIEHNEPADGSVDRYYRSYYKPTAQYGGINLVDLQGNHIYPSEEGDLIIEFDPLFGVLPKSQIPQLVKTRISELFKITETSEPVETIILLDVKISSSED